MWSPVRDLSRVVMKDRRHARRVSMIAKRAMETPRVSFPQMMREESELEGAYRFFSNPKVSPNAILGAHYLATAERVRASTMTTVVAHDTSDLCFGGSSERDGVGAVSNDGKGLSLHTALALTSEGRPLGLLEVETHTRLEKVNSNKTYAKRPPNQKESARWGRTVERAMERVGTHVHSVVHVMDREADSYLLFDQLLARCQSFVIRLCQNRRLVDDEHRYLFDAVEKVQVVVERPAPLSKRTDRNRRVSAKKGHPARSARVAKLALGARMVTVKCAAKARRYAEQEQRSMNVVRVWEPAPPEGEPAVEWLLVTDLPIDTPSQLERIVDYYRLRWTIEEFFKALKTGCSFEERQLESRHALDNALAVLAPIACQMLLLRTVARTHPRAPATTVVSNQQLEVLRVIAARYPLPTVPSVHDALFAIAGLGGFLRRNGDPGWQTLGRGFERLLDGESIWNAAKGVERSDQ
jgi:hypothetical protein